MNPKNWCQICTLLLIEHIKTSVYILSKKKQTWKNLKMSWKNENHHLETILAFQCSLPKRHGQTSPNRPTADPAIRPAHCGCQETRVLGWWLDSAFRAGVVADPPKISKKVATISKWRKCSEKHHHNIIKYPQTAQLSWVVRSSIVLEIFSKPLGTGLWKPFWGWPMVWNKIHRHANGGLTGQSFWSTTIV